jgi:hypothetical protein
MSADYTPKKRLKRKRILDLRKKMLWYDQRRNSADRRRYAALVKDYEARQQKVALYASSIGVAPESLQRFTAGFPSAVTALLKLPPQASEVVSQALPKF